MSEQAAAGRRRVFSWTIAGTAASAILGLVFILQRSALDSATFTYAYVVFGGSFLLGAATAVVLSTSPWPMSRTRGWTATVLLSATWLLVVPMYLEETPSFARNPWLWLSLVPLAMYGPPLARISGLMRSPKAVLGPPASMMVAEGSLGVVRHVINCWAWVGTSRLQAATAGGATAVDVLIADGGVEVRWPRNAARRWFGGGEPMPDLRLRWADIQTVEVTGGRANHNYTVKFRFSGGQGFTLQKGFFVDNLEPLVQALEAHGVRVAGRVILPVVPYGSRPTRRLAVAATCTGLLAMLGASPSWLALGLAPADVKGDPAMIFLYAITGAALVLSLLAVCLILVPELSGGAAHARRTAAILGLVCFSVACMPYLLIWLVFLVWWGAASLGTQIASFSGLALLIGPASAIATLALDSNILIRLTERVRLEEGRSSRAGVARPALG